MQNKLDLLLSRIVNISIVVATCCLILIVWRTYSHHSENQFRPPAELKIGEQLSLGSPDPPSSRTVVFGLQIGCHYCKESLPFYQRLLASANKGTAHFIFIFPNDLQDSLAYLKSNHIQGVDVRSQSLSSIHISGTPTVVLMDASRKVDKFWVGKLDKEQETSVIQSLK